MADLLFKHDVSLAVDFGKAIEARAGEVLAGVPDKIATRLLQRHDVVLADPGLDVRRVEFNQPRRHSQTVSDFIAPPINYAKLIADEKRMQEGEQARKALAARAQAQEQEEKANIKAADDAKKAVAAEDRKAEDERRQAAEREAAAAKGGNDQKSGDKGGK